MSVFFRACRDELKGILTNRGARLILVGAAVVYSLFYPTPYLNEVPREVPLAVVDKDSSDTSRKLVRLVDAGEGAAVVAHMSTEAAARRALLVGKVGAVLTIPYDFEKKLRRGDQITLGLYADASYFLIYRQTFLSVKQAVAALSAAAKEARFRAAGIPREQAGMRQKAATLELRPLFNPWVGYAHYTVPPVLLLVLEQTLLMGVGFLGVANRPRHPTGEPAGRLFSRMLGKTLAYLAVYMVHAVYYFFLVPRIYSLSQRGNPADMLLFVLPFFLATIFLGLALVPVYRYREMPVELLLPLSLPFLFLSGFAWPPECMPLPVRWLAQFVPTTPAIAGFLRISKMGATLADVMREWSTLWLLTGAYGCCAWLSFTREATARR
ncbi:MAG: ABC transporter permease [Desulfovibrio sp.]